MSSIDFFLLDCPTYEDYLNTFTIDADRRFLRRPAFCRLLVSLGYRSNNAVYTKEQFENNKAMAYESLFPTKKSSVLFSTRMTSTDPVLRQLAHREILNFCKIISTVIFLKMRKKSGFEVSGYIDFEQSLRLANRKADNCVDWLGVFEERVMLKPSPSNLSFFDWKKGVARYNNSDNYIVVHDVIDGLKFMHRGDHKMICVDPNKTKYSKNYNSGVWYSNIYGYVILYDHVIRKKI